MPAFIAGLVVLYLLLFGFKQFSRLSPATAARLVRGGGGLLSFLGALLRSAQTPRTGRVSQARSAMIEMRLDRESGSMSGSVLAGPLQGQSLDALTRLTCLDLHATCLRDDPDGARLLEPYLDRRFAGWREAAQSHGDTWRAGANAGAMTEKEAYETLGLAQGAGAEEIARAHRALMKKLHPDHGGATSLAARVNQAKDVLLRRH